MVGKRAPESPGRRAAIPFTKKGIPMFNVRTLLVSLSLALGLVAGCAGEEEDFALADDESALQATDDVTSEADELGPDTVDMTGIGGPVAAAQAINSFVEFANGTVFGEATIHNPDSNVLSMCVKIVRDGREIGRAHV